MDGPERTVSPLRVHVPFQAKRFRPTHSALAWTSHRLGAMSDRKTTTPISLSTLTRIDLPEPKRRIAAEMCDAALANSMVLYTHVKQAHWTVKGPHFFARHELFDTLAAKLLGFVDDLAERCVMLGAVPRGTAKAVTDRTSLPDYTTGFTGGMQHVTALANAYEQHGVELRKAVEHLQKHEVDVATEDLLTEQLREIEQDTWFLASHVQD